MRQRRRSVEMLVEATPLERYYQRFDAVDRGLHAALMVSFLGLSISGLPLLFSQSGWASVLARMLGGVYVAGIIHRLSATLLIVIFVIHLGRVLKPLVLEREWAILSGPTSMVPQPRDFVDLYRHVKWFVGLGPRPRFERYAYWEKFDYWAVFWGMAIIGVSGLMLWFPDAFAHVVPGWMFNIALLIHGEEALLAVVFIFTVHFFNTHMRPEKFPMDAVIFTGRIAEHELQNERADEFDRLRRAGLLDSYATASAPSWLLPVGRVVAVVVLVSGFTIVTLILSTLLFSGR
jgi:cytochrome b subunit of formate dehydrogenase